MKNGLIALCGSKASGKSTVFRMIKDMYDGEIEELSFAAHLKKVCAEVFRIDEVHFHDARLKEEPMYLPIVLKADSIHEILERFDVHSYDQEADVDAHEGTVFQTPRQVLQYVGTELLQPIDKLIHVKIALKKKDRNKLSVLPDMRFLHEYTALSEITEYPVRLMYVKRGAAEGVARKDLHKSEQEVFAIREKCEVLDNNGSLQDLEIKVSELVKSIS